MIFNLEHFCNAIQNVNFQIKIIDKIEIKYEEMGLQTGPTVYYAKRIQAKCDYYID